jgi:hypothetical protein
MCDGVLNKPQIKGETKLPSAVRGWERVECFRFNASTIQRFNVSLVRLIRMADQARGKVGLIPTS